MQQKNFILFVVLSVLIVVGWGFVNQYLFPPPPKPNKTEVAKKEDGSSEQPKEEEGQSKKKGDKEEPKEKVALEKKPEEKKVDPIPARARTADLRELPASEEAKLVSLGSRDRDSRYHLCVEFDPRGAAVRGIWLNKYQAADPQGRPEWIDAEKKTPKPLELLPSSLNEYAPSFQLFAYDVKAPNDDQPLDTLGRIDWTVLERKSEDVEGRRRETVSFQAETQGVLVTKTYTLTEGEYHLGLTVRMRRKTDADKSISFRYQMTGGHGLPVEGKWYTSIFRNTLIARVDKGNGSVTRDLQELRQIALWGGGNEVRSDETNKILYAAVANQYFASAIVVDTKNPDPGFLRQARPTLETKLTKGEIVRGDEDGSSFVLRVEREPEQTFYMQRHDLARVKKGERIAVLHHTASCLGKNGEYPEIVDAIYRNDSGPPSLWMDDVTVRVSSEPVELKGDAEVVHRYLLYHGPAKVSQLFPPPGLSSKPLEAGGVPTELRDRYHDELHLNTLIDYHSPHFMGRAFNFIGMTKLVILCTNFMHAILGYLYAIIGSYGLCIILLTVMVRGMMFPLSRKQALMSMRMQQLQPELKKIQEKYKDDSQARGLAQMELYRKHGINPLGSCWVIMLQMPIFMGLYFALQESTHFRLAEFWPTWIPNLAAPDMLIRWGESIPFISRVEDYGSIFYLGPYFNLLPVIAVIVMIAQQQMLAPPAVDEQQMMQQKMMKYMMIFFGLMFYKVAAGLCLYFIASSVWGFCERKLLPKKKTDTPSEAQTTPSTGGYFHKLLRQARGDQIMTAPDGGAATLNGGIVTSPSRAGGKRGRGKRRQGSSANDSRTEPETGSGFRQTLKRLREWWTAVLKEAQKKNRG
jgi:YidC/Oxa1 family membrane protein insertase